MQYSIVSSKLMYCVLCSWNCSWVYNGKTNQRKEESERTAWSNVLSKQFVGHAGIPGVVQYMALQGGWKKKKLSGNDKLSGLGDTRVNNCTVLIFNYLILFS